MTRRTAKKPATPKFKVGQRVKWFDDGAAIYGVISSVGESGSVADGFVYNVQAETKQGLLAAAESDLHFALPQPGGEAARLRERIEGSITKTRADAVERVKRFSDRLAAALAGGGADLSYVMGRGGGHDDAKLGAEIIEVMRSQDVFPLSGLEAINAERAAKGEPPLTRDDWRKWLDRAIRRLERDLFNDDDFAREPLKHRAKQKVRKLMCEVRADYDRMAECEAWVAAGLPECGEFKTEEFFDW